MQVFVHCLNNNNPVLLDNKAVTKKTFIPQNCVLSIGGCNFRFVYFDGVLSPRKGQITPQLKSPRTPSPGGKENKQTPRATSSLAKKSPKVCRVNIHVANMTFFSCRRHLLHLENRLLSLPSQEKPE